MPNEERIGTAVLELTTDDSSLRKGLAKGERDAGEWAKDVGEETKSALDRVLSVAGGMLAAQGIRAITSGISDMLKSAVQLEPVQRTFENLTETIGEDAVDAMEAMRVATRGMVEDTELLAAGNRLLAMGIADSTKSLTDQIEVATQLGASMGVTAAKAIEDWALLNANLSYERLDLYGISAGKVRTRTNELMATVKDMSRELAFQTATMEEARVAMARVGEQGDDTAGDMARVAAQTENVKILFGQIVTTGLEASGVLGVLDKALQAIKASFEQVRTVQTVTAELKATLAELEAQGRLTDDQLVELASDFGWLAQTQRMGLRTQESYIESMVALRESALAMAVPLSEAGEGVDRWAIALRAAAQEAEAVAKSGFPGLQRLFDTFESDMHELSQIIRQSDLSKALEDALDADQLIDAIRDMGVRAAQIMEDIQSDFADITQEGVDARQEIFVAHDIERLQAQQAFDNEFAALMAAGRTDDANKLAASFANQAAMSERQLALRLQLQQRSILLQKIAQAKAYIAELTEQGDQIRRVFATELAASESFQELGIKTQQAILDIIFEGGSEQLQLEAKMAEARRKISADISAGIITDAIMVQEALTALIGGDLQLAKDRLEDLQAILDNWTPELPPLPEFQLGDVVGVGGTERQIAETVTKPLSQAVNEIARAITAAKRAIEDLIGFELGEGVEQGFDKLGEFVALGITKFQEWFESDPGLEPALDAIKDLFGPVGELLQLLSIDVSKLATFAGDFLPEATRFIWQIREFVGLVKPWLEAIAEHWGVEEVALWAEAARNLKDFFGIMPDLSKVAPIRGAMADPTFLQDATRYIWQIREFTGIIKPWLAAVAEFWTVERVEEWAAVARQLKDFFAILPDLSKVSPIDEPTFTDDATRYIWQIREFTSIIQPWFKAVTDWWTPAKVAEWAGVAKNLASFFAVMPDLSRIVPSTAEDFTSDARDYIWQIQTFSTLIQPWLQAITQWWTPARVEEWAGVAKNLSAFFDLMPDFSVVTPFPGDFTTVFRAFVANIDIAATELMRELERVRKGPLGDVLEELAETADQLGAVMGLLSLASMFEDLQRVQKLKKGERRTALSNVIVVFVQQLKRASKQLKDALPEIEAIWGGTLDKWGIFAEKLADFFGAIRDTIVAGAQIATETDFDVDAIMRLIRLLASLGIQVAAVQWTPLVPVGIDPTMPVMPVLASDPRELERIRSRELEGHAVLEIRLSRDLRAEVAPLIRNLEIRLVEQAAADSARRR